MVARVSGYVVDSGLMNYYMYCDRSDSGVNTDSGSYVRILYNTDRTTYTASDACEYIYSGEYTAKVIVQYGSQSVESRVKITVSAPPAETPPETPPVTPPEENEPPVLNPVGARSINEGAVLTFTLSGSDPEGKPLAYGASGLPSGAIFDPQTRAFRWAPNYSQSGTYNVMFVVSDGQVTDSETVRITVNDRPAPPNSPPVLNINETYSVDEGQTLTFTVSASDPDGNPLTYTASGLPSGARFDSSTRVFSWTPDYGQAGTFWVVFNAFDTAPSSDQQTVTITVNNAEPPEPPPYIPPEPSEEPSLPLASKGFIPCGDEGEPKCQICHAFVVLDRIADYAFAGVIFPLAALLLALGGILMVTGAKNPQNIILGKNIIKGVVIGLTVIFTAWLFFNLFFTLIGVEEWTGLREGWFKVNCPGI